MDPIFRPLSVFRRILNEITDTAHDLCTMGQLSLLLSYFEVDVECFHFLCLSFIISFHLFQALSELVLIRIEGLFL